MQELNALLRERCLAYRQRVQARRNQSVGERLEAERSLLLPLPVRPPECCRIVPVKVDKTSLVQFETNRYSVPSEYAYRILWLKAFVDRVDSTFSPQAEPATCLRQSRVICCLYPNYYNPILTR